MPENDATEASGVTTLLSLAALTVALILVPVLGDDFLAYQTGVYLLYGIAAQGIVLTWGRCGFLPLGQSLFFGLGAYISGTVLKAAQVSPAYWFALPLAVLLPGFIAWLLARVLFFRRHESGPYFSLITLALAMLGFQVANQWSSATGGFNGLSAIPELPHLDRYGTMYWLIAFVCVAVTGFFVGLDRTALGTLWRAIGNNENRLQFFGFATDRLKAWAFALAAGVAGLAGLLYAPHEGLVTPQTASFQLSTELVIWTAVGGRTSPFGALLGTVGIGILSSLLRRYVAYWEVIVALVFIGVVLRFPGGMLSMLTTLWHQLMTRLKGVPQGVPIAVVVNRSPSAIVAPTTRYPHAGTTGNAPMALAIEAIRITHRSVTILDGLDALFATAGVHGIIGPNGAGKTSTFNAVTGRLPVTGGSIRYGSQSIVGLTADAIARLGIGRKFQIPSIFQNLSVTDNLRIATWANRTTMFDLVNRATGLWTTALLDDLKAELPFLVAQGEQRAGDLSQGQRQMLELVMTVIPEPTLLLLDEPCAGLSTGETQRQLSIIASSVERLACTALLIEHDMTAIESLASRVHVLHQGRMLASGTLSEIQCNDDVRRVYAGGSK